jgi:hypothetical protein
VGVAGRMRAEAAVEAVAGAAFAETQAGCRETEMNGKIRLACLRFPLDALYVFLWLYYVSIELSLLINEQLCFYR